MGGVRPCCLTIGASDSSGATGVQADLKAFTAHGCYGAAVITMVQAQSLRGIKDRFPLPDTAVRHQLESAMEDLQVSAVKVGLCPTIAHVRLVARWLREHPQLKVVVDPVAADSRGIPVVDPEVVEALRKELLPRATVITPNRAQAALLLGWDDVLGQRAVEEAARALLKQHGAPVVITDGGASGDCRDVLVGLDGLRHFEAVDYPRAPVQGRSSAFSAAVTANLSRGDGLREAILGARLYVCAAIAGAPQYNAVRNPLWHGVLPDPETATKAWKRQISGEWRVPADG